MNAYLDGDPAAFSMLYRRLAPSILGFFKRSFSQGGMADDMMQQTFLKAHRARATYQRERPVKPWLFAIAGHIRIDEWRRRAREQNDLSATGDDVDGISEAPGSDMVLESMRQRTDILTALDALPEPQRVVVHLHHFEGLSFAEIAVAVGGSEGAAKVRASRAYEKLRTLLERR